MRMNNEAILTLISKVNSSEINSIGELINTENARNVFCIKKSVRQSEFFQAQANGFKVEIVLEMNSFEYENEEICLFEGEKFKIYRAFPIKNERIELYLTTVVGESNVTS